MSTMIMSACWSLQGMSAAQKSVLVSLADNANDEGVCWPSVARIASRTCLSERAVRNALRWLEDSSLISSAQRYGRSTYSTVTPARYAPGIKCPPAGDAAPPRQEMPDTPAPGAPRTVIEPPFEPPLPPQGADVPPAAEKIQYEKIRELYNTILGSSLPRCMGLTDKHRKGIKACHNLKLDGEFPVRDGGLDFWEGLFNDVLDCEFLLGSGNRSWRADFEFITTSTKLQKFMEGKYDAR